MKLRYSIYLLFACASLSGLSSCADNDYANPDSDRVAVTFAPQIEGSETRAVDQTWSAGDKVGVCMVADKAALPAASTFNQYTVSGAGTSVGLSPVTVDQTLFYPTDGSDVNFVAFSPYATVASNAVSYSTFAAQSTQADMEKVDFLYHKGSTAYNKTSTSAALAFGHKLSKIIINATTAGDATAITLSSLAMTITGTPSSVSASLADGSITAGGSNATIAPYHTDGSSTRIATAILVPHAAKAGRTITFTATEGNFTYTFPSDDFAFESNKVYTLNFKITRQGAELTDATIDNWTAGTVDWTGKYMFELLNDSFAFTADANTTTTMAFNSNSGTAPTVELSTSATNANAGVPAWVTGALTTSAESGYTAYTYTFNVTENTDGSAREAYAHILNGATSLGGVPLKQKGTYEYAANSYMMKPSTTDVSIQIPVNRANEHAAWVNDATAKIGDADALTAVILWSDVQGLITVETVGAGATGAIKVTVPAASSAAIAATTEGNAVVAVKVGGVIKWSWHIWVTNYVPAPIGALGWMDRNLGATSNKPSADLAERYKTYGLLYQWGRKDPFPNSGPQTAATTAVEPTLYGGDAGTSFTYGMKESEVAELGAATMIKAAQSISYTVANPMTFIAMTGSWQNSPASATTDNNWGYQGGKELYDPCPEGYRVPKNGSWGTAIATTDYPWNTTYLGRDLFPFGGWYPASGRRANTTGALSSVGSSGCAWSASPSSAANGNYLILASGSVSPAGNSGRTLGCGVRCLLDQ